MTILIIGLGSIALKHIDAIKANGTGHKIFALRSSPNAVQVDGVQSIHSLEELHEKPDFVIISNPTHLHEEAILSSLSFGCPLFIEKPVLSNMNNAEHILARIKEEGVLTYVACNLRFHPAIEFMKDILIKDALRVNEVNIYCGSYLPDWRPGKDFRTIYSANAHMGGGVHLDLIHELDYCTWLFGMPQQCVSTTTNKSSLDISAVDYAHYALSYPEFTASITLNYFRRKPKRSMEVLLDSDTWTMDLLTSRITTDSGKTLFSCDFNMRETYVKQMQHFMNCVSSGKESINAIGQGLHVLSLCLQNVPNAS